MAKEKKGAKTNAVRALETKKINYVMREYDITDGKIDGISVAEKTGMPQEAVFKTLVTVGTSKEHYVFVVPVNKELNLKKAANCFSEKKVEMIPMKELLSLTGYIHGGCSPIGMKKKFKTAIDETLILNKTICISAGKVGLQIEIAPEDLISITDAKVFDLTE